MTNEALIASVREQLFVGRSKDDIARALIEEGGWGAEDVREAFAVVEGPHPAQVESPAAAPTPASMPAENPPPPLLGTLSLAWWQRVALAALLLMGASIAVFATVPAVRSLVFGPTPLGEEALNPEPSGNLPNIPLTPEPESDTPLLRGEDAPTAPAAPALPTPSTPQPSAPPATLPATKPASDTTAPAVSVSGPAAGTTLSGSAVAITASASDGVGVTSVQFLLDGRELGIADTLAPYSTTWDTTKSPNGTHTLSARARDAAGNIGNSSSVSVTVSNSAPVPAPTPTPTPTPDTTAPTTPANLSVTAVSSSQLNLTWSASTDAVGVTGYKLERCQGASCTNYTEIATPSTTSYNNTGLVAATTYRYRVRATDAAGNLSGYSSVVSGTTQAAAPAPDTTAPTISITVPSSGATLSGSASVAASASDSVGVAGVQFLLDGANLGAEDTTSPFVANWDTTSATNGSHTLTAVARDAAGNQTTSSSVSVTVSNAVPDTTAPTVSVAAPTSGATVSGSSVSVSASASDNIGVAGVQFKLDGTNLGAEDTTSPYSTTWNTTTAANGTHTITAVARDAAGNQTTSSSVSVTVSNTTPDTTAPTISVTAPSNGATVSGSSVSVSASASDNIGVAGVQFKLDGTNLGAEDTTSPYSTTWNTTTAANGTHTITAVARDAAGNQTTSSSVSVTVSNAVPDTTAPTTPANLSVTAVSSSQLNLTWSASTDAVGVTGYKLERCQGASCTNYTEIATPSTTSYNNTGLVAATTYRYRVRATDAAGNLSGYSSVVSGTTQAAAPTTVTVSMGDTAYSPVNLTITLGTTVIFRNDWTSDRWPASDSHPQHNIYPAFDPLGPIAPGASWSFTFDQVGVWGYHDHIKPSIGGYITVQ